MFLTHMGAGMHGHEFSDKKRPNGVQTINDYIPRRNPLTRSTYSTPIPQRSTVAEKPVPILVRPARPQSEYIPRAVEQIVRFQEPEPAAMSDDDGRSLASSRGSETATRRGKRPWRQSLRTNSTYQLAHPAPTSLTQRQKLLLVRPKLLLQLQQISPESRPKPAVDVLPSTVVLSRLMKKFPRMFRGKNELGSNDVMVVKSEDYGAVESIVDANDSDEDSLANRELMAVICQMPKERGGSSGKAEIVLDDGSVWIAEPLSTGAYEFRTIDDRGNEVVARWVKKVNNRRKSADATEFVDACEFKYTFSIIDPNSRRHPILASINETTLKIPDSYTSVSASSRRYPPTTPITIPGAFTYPVEEECPPERTTHVLDDRTKILIQVTGIWVALRQGWSPYFKYNDAMASVTCARNRSSSLTPDVPRPNVLAGTPDSNHSTFGAVLGSKMRRVSGKVCVANPTPPQFEHQAIPQRSVSAGTAFMQRTAARRMGATPSIVASDSEGESFMGPPRRAATESLTGSNASTPPPLALGSAATTPDTPTRPQRRPHSTFIPSSALQNGFTNSYPQEKDRLASYNGLPEVEGANPKNSRWKAFTNFFRRTNTPSRSN